MVHFWETLPLVEPKQQLLKFHTQFRDVEELYIRNVYSEFYSRYIMQYPYVIITGNPGIGKSYFSLYVLYRLRKEKDNPVIVYVSVPSKLVVLFEGNTVSVETDEIMWADQLSRKETFYLFDAGTKGVKTPVVRQARTVVFSSPSRSNYHDFEKERLYGDAGNGVKVYMPTWSWNELDALCTIKGFDRGTIRHRFDHCGGIPRSVLSSGYFGELNEAINNCNPEKIVELASTLRSGDIREHSHKVLHINVTTKLENDSLDYTNAEISFASNYVADEIFKKYKQKSENVLIELLTRCKYNWMKGVCGMLFERFAHNKFLSDGDLSYDTRCLQQACKVEKVSFGKLREEPLENLANVASYKDACGVYLKPIPENFETVDSIIPPNIGFQMTVSLTHPVKLHGLQKIVEALGCTKQAPFRLYFVVSREEFKQYREQKYHDNRKKPKKRFDYKAVEQWVLCMDLA